ncbi:DUF1801 domain-containing protein [Gilvimarinus agarilyticus]|uniref:DUF1801 domain-containing protein n=1 Tax=Gilvimarinus agarilyticus TaxID=679259 RepID=UPI000A06C675|nr:DUF1801 domain-containing protein [Gilvimarinus agarilyticus]
MSVHNTPKAEASNLTPFLSDEVEDRFSSYPVKVLPVMLALRELLFSTAKRLNLTPVEETLKWGEPSYLVNGGSAVRMDWKAKTPDEYFLFFHCQTKLVDTFRELYAGELVFQGNRAIVLPLDKPLPEQKIAHCVELALRYQSLKSLPLMGA